MLRGWMNFGRGVYVLGGALWWAETQVLVFQSIQTLASQRTR